MTFEPLPYQSGPPPRDFEHVKLLAVFSYIWGGIEILFACLGFIYVGLGLFFVNAAPTMAATNPSQSGEPPPAFVGWMVFGFGAAFVAIGWTIGGLNLYSARCMQRQKFRMFSLIVAGINCVLFPFGTVMGIFTFVVLLRQSTAQLYMTSPETRQETKPR